MLKVLIVDDDKLVREMLTHIIDWQAHGFEVIGEAVDGQSCIDIYDEVKPDLIILDMSMPQLNGLDVIKYIREKDQLTKIVVLSCHDDFDYVKEAMQLNADEYVLKHLLTPDLLLNLLNKLKEKHALEVEKMHTIQVETALHNEGKCLVKEQILRHSIKNESLDQQMLDKIKRYFPLLQTKQFNMMLLQLNSHLDIQDKVLYKLVRNIVDETLEQLYDYEFIDVLPGQYALLIHLKKTSAVEIKYDLENIVKMIEFAMTSYARYEFKFLLSYERLNYKCFHKMYKNLNNKKHEFFYSDEIVLDEHHVQNFKYVAIKLSGDLLRTCQSRVDNNAFNELKELLSEEVITISYFRTFPKWYRCYFIELIRSIFDYVVFRYKLDNTNSAIGDYVEDIRQCRHMHEVEEKLHDFVDFLAKFFDGEEANFDNIYINDAIKYINTHFSQGISLVETAAYLGVNSSYLSSLFKTYTGVNFVDHVKQIRMNKACDYLLHTDMKVKDICEAVGVPNRKYFSKTFKKLIGVSPLDYKKSSRYEE